MSEFDVYRKIDIHPFQPLPPSAKNPCVIPVATVKFLSLDFHIIQQTLTSMANPIRQIQKDKSRQKEKKKNE